jgi:4,5-dihydroxyphthalate decarboxylase
MTKLKCSLACCDYDRTRAIFDGRVAIEGCDVTAVTLEPEESFLRARYQVFDITEQSFSTHAILTAKGQNPYVGVPVFVSRVFRHSGIYIRTDRGINGPPDLRGKTIGVPEYAMTASVWIRGMFQDDYGVKPADVRWRQGATDHPLPPLPGQIELQHIPHGYNLSDMLAAGEIDAIIGARQPACFTQRHEKVARLFPNYREAERDYYRRTRIFPTMHVIGIRRSLAEAHPWLPVSVFKAFAEAKRRCMPELAQIGFLYTTLPWSVAEFEDTIALMGEDYWPYGVKPNLQTIETFARYHHAQGLSQEPLSPKDLFASQTLELV